VFSRHTDTFRALCYLWLCVSSNSQEGGVKTVGMSMCVMRAQLSSLYVSAGNNGHVSGMAHYRQGGRDSVFFTFLRTEILLHVAQRAFLSSTFIWHLGFWNRHEYADLCPFGYEIKATLQSKSITGTDWQKCLKRGQITVFLSRFGTFLRSELKFSKLLVQPPHHLVTCAHHKSSFSFFWTNCKCFGTFRQLIMYNCLLFPTLSCCSKCIIWFSVE